MKFFIFAFVLILGFRAEASISATWDGDFLGENHFMKGFDFSSSCAGGQNCTPNYSTGYVNRGFGTDHTNFSTIRLRLQPVLLVNDNFDIRSRLRLGTYFFGGNPSSAGTRQFSTTAVGDTGVMSAVNVDQLYADWRLDFGKLEIGRAPVHWGLGAYWNAGKEATDRFSDTHDTVNFSTRLGPMKFNFGFAKVVEGRLVGSSQQSTPTSGTNATIPYRGGTDIETVGGSDNLYDYFASLMYEWEAIGATLGAKATKRKGGTHQTAYVSQNAYSGTTGETTATLGLHNALNYSVYDIYFDKKFSHVGISQELILIDGEIGNMDADSRVVNSKTEMSPDKYSAFAWVSENYWEISSRWKLRADLGFIPGASSESPGNERNRFHAVFLSPAYQKGLFMLGRNWNNLGASANTNQDAYAAFFNTSITNTRYVAPRVEFAPNEYWYLYLMGVFGKADKVALKDSRYYDHRRGKYVYSNEEQSSELGYEIDGGFVHHWSDQISVLFDAGIFNPGKYYSFDNRASDAVPPTDFMWGTQVRLAVKF